MAKNNKQTAGQDSVSKMVALGSKKFIAQQLNYARTTGDVQSHNSCCAIAEGISSRADASNILLVNTRVIML